MADSSDPTADETDFDIRRVCSILESIAEQYPNESPESLAIADTASAYILVRQHRSLALAYQRLKAALNGQLTDEMVAKLKAHGIDPDDLDDVI